MLLRDAVEAGLPLIVTTTRDLVNLADVIAHVTGKKVEEWKKAQTQIEPSTLYYVLDSKNSVLDYTRSYNNFTQVESSLIIVNPLQPIAAAYDAGPLPVPKDMLVKFLQQVVSTKKKASELSTALGGCTIKEAVEAVRLTMARDTALTLKGLIHTRKTSFPSLKGLTQVDPDQFYYSTPPNLAAWIAKEKEYFLGDYDPRLRPRGLLFKGQPGTGKTEAAKKIAADFGVALYRLDIAGMKNKYIGATQDNLNMALAQLDQEEPCVALLDEIEKIFRKGGDGDHEVTQDMLSQMLWWEQEHRSRVLLIMTTNDLTKIPEELVRPGRIDKHLDFMGLAQNEIDEFARNYLATFKHLDPDLIDDLVAAAIPKPKGLTTGSNGGQKTPQAVVIEKLLTGIKNLPVTKTIIKPKN